MIDGPAEHAQVTYTCAVLLTAMQSPTLLLNRPKYLYPRHAAYSHGVTDARAIQAKGTYTRAMLRTAIR